MSSPASESFAAQATTGFDSFGARTVPCPPTSEFMSGKNEGKVFGRGFHGVASVVDATADGTEPSCIPPTMTAALATAANPARAAPTPANRVQRRTPQR